MHSLEEMLALFLLLTEDEELIILVYNKPRTVIYNRSWYGFSLDLYDDVQFKSSFRMSKSCLNFIIEKFFNLASLPDTRKNRLYSHMLIYYAVHNISYRALGEKFGVPASSVFRNLDFILHKFNRSMGQTYIKRPIPEEMSTLAEDFSSIRDLYGTILAIDGTHIPIDASKNRPEQYINRKGWHSIVFQLVVDSKYIIRDVFGGYPDSSHDAFIYTASSIKDYISNEIPHPYVVIGVLPIRQANIY